MSSEGREQELLDWMHGDLSPERKAAVDAHLRECAECRTLARDLGSLSAGLARLREVGDRTEAAASVLAPPSAGGKPARSWRWAPWRWAAAAVLVLVSASLFILARGSPERAAGPTPGFDSTVSSAGTGARELLDVERTLRTGGGSETLERHLRTSASVPVRLAALSGPVQGDPPVPAAELVEAFERADDLMLRLWLVVAVARSGDLEAAARVRGLVAGMEGAPVELRAAVEGYL